MFKVPVLNDFYEELFSTDFKGYDSSVQNAKSDSIALNPDITFEEWLDELIDVFCNLYEDEYCVEEVKAAIDADPTFADEMSTEYEELKELLADLRDDDDGND